MRLPISDNNNLHPICQIFFLVTGQYKSNYCLWQRGAIS